MTGDWDGWLGFDTGFWLGLAWVFTFLATIAFLETIGGIL